ncbi:hypothetical protein MPHO_05020 [Mycolicibacterium phocaicum]|nr:hypothetical protein MPHO_05020 [Mycolicibacterium phocaicum]
MIRRAELVAPGLRASWQGRAVPSREPRDCGNTLRGATDYQRMTTTTRGENVALQPNWLRITARGRKPTHVTSAECAVW